MDPGQWIKIKQTFSAVAELPLDERAAFLEKSDPAIREEVEKLLAASDSAGDFIASPLHVENGHAAFDDKPMIGREIDDYVILDKLGEGGMGTVYLAEHHGHEFSQRVALKLIKRGMDTNAVLKRFLTERQILATLEHPNIARLLDGGSTDDGLPYFVMELVQGENIRDFCDRRQYGINERLELFQKVCNAISHAHQKLIVHRDIKPSNIVVTDKGEPKLLDFGIAKLLSPDWDATAAEATATNFRLMTPEYASPEQLRGQMTTTATDVYSLGVVLYELLTGARPYKFTSKDLFEISREILTIEPPRPSSVVSSGFQVPSFRSANRTVAESWQPTAENEQKTNPKSKIPNPKSLLGDLDNIILKSLRKDPKDRYRSVEELAEDIDRYLKGLPVRATADSRTYRLKKFVARNRIATAVAALILLLSGVAVWQAAVANRERERAEERFNQVRKLANSVLFEYQDGIERLPGSTPIRMEMISDALEYLDNLSTESGDNPSLLREVASAYQKVGDIQGNPYYSNFGDMESALQSYQKALAIREQLATRDPLDQRSRLDLSEGYASVADIKWAQGDYAAALESYLKSLSIIEALAAEDSGNTSNQQTLAARHYSVGQTLRKLGDAPGAIASFQKSLEIDQALLAVEPENQTYRQGIATKSVKIGDVYFDAENYSEALLHHQKGVEIFELLASNEDDAVSQRIYALFLNRVASDKQGLGNSASAIDLNLKAVAILKPLLAADPQNEQYRLDMATYYKSLGSAYLQQNRLNIAIDFLKQAVAIFTESLKNNRDREAQQDLDITYKLLGDCLTKAGKTSEAKGAYLKGNKYF